MEMDLLQRSGVNPGFCLADDAENFLCQSTDLLFQGSLIQHVHDVGVMTVDVIVMAGMGFRTVGVVVNVSFALMKMFVKFRSMRVIVLFMEMVCIAMLPVRVLMRINWLAL